MKFSKFYFAKEFFKVPMFAVFFVICLFFGLPAIGEPAEINRYAVATAIGIDMSEEEEGLYDVSLLVFSPVAEQSFTERYVMVSSTGSSVSEAIDFAGLNLGREIGLSHIRFVVLSEEMLQDDVSKSLDYLVRNVHLTASAKLIVTNSTAKEFVSAAQSLDSQSSIKVSEIVSYNDDYIYATDSSLETFFKGTYGPTRVGQITYLTLDSGEEEGLPTIVDPAGQSASGQSQGSEQKSKEIINDGQTIFCKDGTMVIKLDGKEFEKVNLVSGNFTTGSLEVYGVTDEDFTNANLIFEIFDKSYSLKAFYENGGPIVNIDLALGLRLSEIQSEEKIAHENVELFILSDTAIKEVEKALRKNIAEGLQIMRDNSLDIADFYTFLHNDNISAFKKFLASLEDEGDYLNHIVFKSSIRLYAK